jgi:hypothetical protein
MLYQIEPDGNDLVVTKEFREKSASELGIQEKAIENWISKNPKLLFPNEEVMIIGQSISGQNMADILALDTLGRLVVVEIKRDWSDRATVAQLLEYAANLQGAGYERLSEEASKYRRWKDKDLIAAFRQFADNEDFQKEELGIKQRVFIVAPDADEGLKKIVAWLKEYGVPIEFIPFKIISNAEGDIKFIEIEGVQSETEPPPTGDSWAGHWIFNTNESYGPGAYDRMFKQGVIAVYGYPNGPRNLMRGATKGEKIFAYVNGQGIRALGTIVNGDVKGGKGIFFDEKGKQQPEEYHMQVKWDRVLPEAKALSNREASSFGYNLPFRVVFGRLKMGKLAKRLEEAIVNRN